MMKNISTLIIVVFLLIFMSQCKIDEEKVDTIYPDPYFPAFPGSYWVYNENEILRVRNDYYPTEYGGTTINLPCLEGPNLLTRLAYARIRKNYISNSWTGYCGLGTYGPKFRPLYLFITGRHTDFSCDPDNSIHWGNRTLHIDTSMIIGNTQYDSIIVSIQYEGTLYDYFGLPLDSIWENREYYAKRIGLVMREERDLLTSWDTLGELVISGYENEFSYILTDFNIVYP